MQRFQQLYEAAEREASVEKRQLALLHQQRVQAEMDDRKRRLLQKYVDAVDDDDDQQRVDVSAATVTYHPAASLPPKWPFPCAYDSTVVSAIPCHDAVW